jgi:hypothetical protein
MRPFLQPALSDPNKLLGLVGEWQETTPIHDVREEHELTLIGTEYFAYQDETQ